jgi:hypothetical protein
MTVWEGWITDAGEPLYLQTFRLWKNLNFQTVFKPLIKDLHETMKHNGTESSFFPLKKNFREEELRIHRRL